MEKASALWSSWLVVTMILTIFLATNAQATNYPTHPNLTEDFYLRTCPQARIIVFNVLVRQLALNKNLPAQLIRLFFHDCFVRGCDSSILIESTPGNVAELDGFPNRNSVKGLDVIALAKEKLEESCPGIVSCADIIALAARDILQLSRGLYFPVPLGRRDGSVSLASEANANLPSPFANYTQLVTSFANQGLSEEDLVVLSGAHTIGVSHCGVVYRRLWNFSPTIQTDPAMSPAYAAKLKALCPIDQPQSQTEIELDSSMGGNFFDSNYYDNVLNGEAAFISDSALITNPSAAALVRTLGRFPTVPFFEKFGVAMVKMGLINVKTGSDGVIRKVCSKI
ncbi:peroxidase [Marchantia polymorpha subsp. ruderalis]